MVERMSKQRPTMKGVLHAISAVIFGCLAPLLLLEADGDIIVPYAMYLLFLVGHFMASAIFHCLKWDKRVKIYPRKLDHVMIFGKMAATYNLMFETVAYDISDTARFLLVIGTICGITLRLFATKAPKIIIGLPYVLVGWSAIVDYEALFRVRERIPVGANLILTSGLLYTIGAAIYMLRWPNIFPGRMEFHELFHLLNTLGTALLFTAIYNYVIPYRTEMMNSPYAN